MYSDGYYSFSSPLPFYLNQSIFMVVAVEIAVIVGVVLFCTFMKKKNENKYTGFLGKLYNFLVFNRFYTENILKLLYVVFACVITAIGIVNIATGLFVTGFLVLVLGNIGLRVLHELMMMFLILCKKSTAIDKKLETIKNFYDDQYDDFDDAEDTYEDNQCDGTCEDCNGCETEDDE